MLPALPPTPHRISVQSSERIGRFFAAKPRESKSRFPWFWAVSRGLRGGGFAVPDGISYGFKS